jgi:predicted  nucleic acid-binding Zn-ribbon protein
LENQCKKLVESLGQYEDKAGHFIKNLESEIVDLRKETKHLEKEL